MKLAKLMEVMKVRKEAMSVMEYVIHNKTPGMKEDEEKQLIRLLSKLDNVLEDRKDELDWIEEEVIKKDLKSFLK